MMKAVGNKEIGPFSFLLFSPPLSPAGLRRGGERRMVFVVVGVAICTAYSTWVGSSFCSLSFFLSFIRESVFWGVVASSLAYCRHRGSKQSFNRPQVKKTFVGFFCFFSFPHFSNLCTKKIEGRFDPLGLG